MNTSKILRLIANPSALLKLDRDLLLNHPVVWGSRVHYVVYYGFLANTILYLVTRIFLKPDFIAPYINITAAFFLIVEIFIIFYWMFRQSIYDVDKQHGQTQRFWQTAFSEMLAYGLCFLVLFSPSIIQPKFITQSIAPHYSDGCISQVNDMARHNSSPRTLYERDNYEDIEECINVRAIAAQNFFQADIRSELDETLVSKLKKIRSNKLYDIKKQNEPSSNRKAIAEIQESSDFYDILINRRPSEYRLKYYSITFMTFWIVCVICWPLFMLQKFTSWSTLSWLGLTVAVLLGVIVPLLFLIDQLGQKPMKEISAFIAMFIFVACMAVFIRITTQKSYSSSSAISFSVGLMALSVSILIFKASDSAYLLTKYYFVLSCTYILLYPISKKLLVLNSFMPRKT
jgi:hypothetical protein